MSIGWIVEQLEGCTLDIRCYSSLLDTCYSYLEGRALLNIAQVISHNEAYTRFEPSVEKEFE